MPTEIDFSKGVRGKFYHAAAVFSLPIYLDAEVPDYLPLIAAKKGMPVSDLANDILKREISIIEMLK